MSEKAIYIHGDPRTPSAPTSRETNLWLDAHGLSDKLIITPYPNGGYTVHAGSLLPCYEPKLLGAFTSKGDMITALAQ